MKKRLFTTACFFLTSAFAMAAIEPVIITLPRNGASYTAPGGKILVIRHAAIDGVASTVDRLRLSKGGTTNSFPLLRFFVDADPTNPSFSQSTHGESLNTPLIIPANTTLNYTSSAGGVNLILAGLLVDASDLYVAVENEIESIQLAGLTQVDLGVLIGTPRPVRIEVDSTDDILNGWVNDPTGTFQPGADATRYTATVDVGPEDRLYRTRAIPLN